jgi:hypothetical protein
VPSLNPADHNWDRQLEEGYPDCRVKPIERDRSRIAIGRMIWDKVFCGSCGAECGATPPDNPHVFFMCDGCFFGIGGGETPPGTKVVA